jgi:hypothetical protein
MEIAQQTEQVAKVEKVLYPPTVYALLERSYLESQKKEQDVVGEIPLGALTVALSLDQSSKPILTFVSPSDWFINEVRNNLRKEHKERSAAIDLPDADIERITRQEAIDVLTFLQRLEKVRAEEKERLAAYESELQGNEQEAAAL